MVGYTPLSRDSGAPRHGNHATRRARGDEGNQAKASSGATAAASAAEIAGQSHLAGAGIELALGQAPAGRVLLAAQPELVTPVQQVVQRVVTRHLIAGAQLEADEGQGGSVTLI